MKELKYITRSGPAWMDMDRAFIAYHPANDVQALEQTCQHILHVRDLVLYYDPDSSSDWDEMPLDFLAPMLIMIVLVTHQFLNWRCVAKRKAVPYALEHKIPVLPILEDAGLVKTFKENYGDMRYVLAAPEDEEAALSAYEKILGEALQRLLPVRMGRDTGTGQADLRYLFSMSSLYLRRSGKQMQQKGMDGLHQAAQKGLPEAMEALARIYRDGDGVPADPVMSVTWLSSLSDYWKGRYKASQSYGDFTLLVRALFQEGDAWRDIGELDRARETYGKIFKIAERWMETTELGEPRHFLSQCYGRSGDLYMQEGDLAQGREQKRLALEHLEEMERLGQLPPNTREKFQNVLDMLHLSLALDDAPEQRKWYEQAIKVGEALIDAEGQADDIVLVADMCNALGDLCIDEEDLLSARQWYDKGQTFGEKGTVAQVTTTGTMGPIQSLSSLEDMRRAGLDADGIKQLMHELLGVVKTALVSTDELAYWRSSIVAMKRSGAKTLAGSDIQDAAYWYELYLTGQEAYAARTGALEDQKDLVKGYIYAGDVFHIQKNYAKERTCREKALQLQETVVEKDDTAGARSILSVTYERYGTLFMAEGDMDQALSWLDRAIRTNEEAMEQAVTTQILRHMGRAYSQLSRWYRDQGDDASAQRCSGTVVDIYQQVVAKTGNVPDQRELYKDYALLASTCKKVGDLEEAIRWAEKSVEGWQALATDTQTMEDWAGVSAGYRSLGDIYREKGEQRKALDWYEKLQRSQEMEAKIEGTNEAWMRLAWRYVEMGDLCVQMGLSSEARKWYEDAIALAQKRANKTKDTAIKWEAYDMLLQVGHAYQEMGDLQEPEQFFLQAVKIAEQMAFRGGDQDDQRKKTVIYCELGRYYLQADKLSSAFTWVDKGLKLRERVAQKGRTEDDSLFLMKSYYTMGCIELRQERARSAQQWISRAIEIGEELEEKTQDRQVLHDLANCYQQMCLVSRSMEDPEGALHWQEQAEALWSKLADA